MHFLLLPSALPSCTFLSSFPLSLLLLDNAVDGVVGADGPGGDGEVRGGVAVLAEIDNHVNEAKAVRVLGGDKGQELEREGDSSPHCAPSYLPYPNTLCNMKNG